MSTTIGRLTITDDSGSGTNGTVADAAWVATLEDAIDAMYNGASPFYLGGALGLGRYTTTATGTQNNWDIDAANSGTSVGVLRCNNGSALTINGIVAPTGHRVLIVLPINSSVVLAHEAGGSTAANRITTQGAANVTVLAGGCAVLLYDVTTARWRLVDFGVVPPGGTSTFLRADGTWAAAAGGGFTEQTTTATGNQDNFSLSASQTYLRCTGAAPNFRGFTIGGAAPTAGCQVLVDCLGTTAKVAHQDTNSTAANRLICQSVVGQIVGLNGLMLCVYDATTSRWRVSLLDAGNPISVTYASGNFTGSGTITWTVDSGDQESFWYQQFGKVLQVAVSIATSTVSGTGAELRVAIPGGFTTTRFAASPLIMGFDNNVATPVNQFVNAADTNLHFGRQDAANWAAATNTTYVRGQQTFEVD